MERGSNQGDHPKGARGIITTLAPGSQEEEQMSILEYIAQHYMETTKMGQEEISLFDMRKKLFQELKKSEDDEEMDKLRHR